MATQGLVRTERTWSTWIVRPAGNRWVVVHRIARAGPLFWFFRAIRFRFAGKLEFWVIRTYVPVRPVVVLVRQSTPGSPGHLVEITAGPLGRLLRGAFAVGA